jgi:hypothetical protein
MTNNGAAQITRVEVEYFAPSSVLKGRALVLAHTAKDSNDAACWVFDHDEDSSNAFIVNPTRDKIEFFKPSFFLRVSPLGLEYDGIFNGDLDFLTTLQPITELLRPAIPELMKQALPLIDRASLRSSVVFMAVLVKTEPGYIFAGILPLDQRLAPVLISSSEEERIANPVAPTQTSVRH